MMPMYLKTYNQGRICSKSTNWLAGTSCSKPTTRNPTRMLKSGRSYGIEPQQTNPFGKPVISLVAVCGETEAVIPGFNPRTEATLEYDITRLITRVAWPEKPVVGVLSSLSVLGTPPNPMMMRRQQQDQGWIVFRELRKDYTVREIQPDTEAIDADVTTLIVVHPKNLEDKALFAIDQFVLRGGRLIVCVDPFNIADFEADSSRIR